jgi:hypothetical protein
VIESLLHAVRGAAFAIRCARREGGLVLLCALLEFARAGGALSLVKRVPDVVSACQTSSPGSTWNGSACNRTAHPSHKSDPGGLNAVARSVHNRRNNPDARQTRWLKEPGFSGIGRSAMSISAYTKWSLAATSLGISMNAAVGQDIPPVNSGANPYRVIRDWAQLRRSDRRLGGVAMIATASRKGHRRCSPGPRPAVSAPRPTRSLFDDQARKSGLRRR